MAIPSRREEIAAGLSAVRQRLARALERAGRLPSGAKLVAVSKTHPAEDVRAAFDAGQADFGENRVQEALEKIAATADIPITCTWSGTFSRTRPGGRPPRLRGCTRLTASTC